MVEVKILLIFNMYAILFLNCDHLWFRYLLTLLVFLSLVHTVLPGK